MFRMRAGLALLVSLFAIGPALAQSGRLTVAVSDADDAPLPGATVTISHETGSVKTTALLTADDGLAEFPVLRAGSGYSIVVSFPGYNSVREQDIRVPLGGHIQLPVRMIEGLDERVRITAEREVVDLDTSEQATKFSDAFVADLPVPGRFYQNVLTMAPGVQDADGDGNPNVHGSRSRDFQAIVSGVSNVDPLTGQWMSNVNPNSIEEIEVISAGAGVEFGRAQGGFARIVQKQGSNRHEGTAEFFYRTSKIDGDGAGNYTGLPPAEFDWIQPSIHVSGPILRDHMWYRVSLENRDIERPVNIGVGLETQKVEEKTRDAQLTWQVSPRNKLALNYRYDPRKWSNQGVSSLIGADASYIREWDGTTTSLTWTAPFSPRILIESTLAWSDLNFIESPNTPGALNACVETPEWLAESQCTNLDSGKISGAHATDNDDHRQRLTISGKATTYGRLWGVSHQLKAGVHIEGERYFRSLVRRPETTFATIIVGDERYGQLFPTLSVPQTDDVRATGNNWALYLEDQIKPRQNLTITVGVRVDREEITAEGAETFDPTAELDELIDTLAVYADPESPQFDPARLNEETLAVFPSIFTGYEDPTGFQSEIQAILCENNPNPNTCRSGVSSSIEDLFSSELEVRRRSENQNIINTNFSPYLALAWSPFSNGKTAFKVAAGRHYNNIPLIVPLQELEPARISVEYRQRGIPQTNQFEKPRPFGGINPSVNVITVDRDLRTPYQDEFTLSLERELWTETALSLTYIHRSFEDQIQDKNINVANGDYGRCNRPTLLSPSPLIPNWGEGDTLIDPYTLEEYIDDNPGPGDGRDDDCVGAMVASPDTQVAGLVPGPDDVLERYVQNPFWADVFLVGNFNAIDYEAFVLELVRRQYRGWEMQASYTWSEARGNGEDFFQELGNDPSLRGNQFGFQSYDQRHVVKLNAATITPWGVRLGTAVTWQSGLPYSIVYQQSAQDIVPFWSSRFGTTQERPRQSFPTGSRNSERNSAFWNIDVRAAKEFNLGRGVNMQVSVEIFNLLDDGTYQVYNTSLERGEQLNGINESIRRFGREWQLGLKIAF